MKSLKNDPPNKLNLILVRAGFSIYMIKSLLFYLLRKTIILRVLLGMALAIILMKVVIFKDLPVDMQNFSHQVVKIPSGSNFGQIADSLSKRDLIDSKSQFVFLGRLSGKDKEMKSGLFKIPQGLNTWQMINYLESAKNLTVKVTLPEGISAAEMAGILQKSIEIDSSRFMSLVEDTFFIQSLGLNLETLDGYLLPETYYLNWEMSERELVDYLVNKTMEIFSPDSVQRQLINLNKSINEIMTLASIIEGEVQVDSERVIVSSVYHNRLMKGWLLQADPTIQYILKGSPRRLTYKDLKIDSPYNTYLYPGLPPSPINNPGKSSILAALFPANTSYFYFVAAGDGSHRFSRNTKEHLYWKRKFDEVRRQVRFEERQKQSKN
jgi:UPF0755 protein